MSNLVYIVLFFALAAFAFWVFIHEYRRYRVDLLRSRLFDIRDDLYCWAHESELDFDSPAYGLSRLVINGMIARAETLTVPSFFAFWVVMKLYPQPEEYTDRFSRALNTAINKLDENSQNKIREYLFLAHVAVIDHLIWSFFFTYPFALLTYLIAKITRFAGIQKRILSELVAGRVAWDDFDTEASRLGEIRASKGASVRAAA